ncbi:Ribosome biogenesis protein erb1 [Naganishia cerealis]|uniref:Ribosome biogenesis protein erb1 n=1 Tax=Naganishia cerealis TaxID=610337 RepID=A0ACC2VW39_9TREE|nr:Ribosome biogenesis protein erb1 [Naganishia cerealis]
MPPKRSQTAPRSAGSKRNPASKATPSTAVSGKPAVKRSRDDDRDAPSHGDEVSLFAGKINGGDNGKGKKSAVTAEVEEDEDDEEFEIDTGSSNGDLEDFLDRDALESPADDEDEEDEEGDDDDEEGYNTSDIEAMENASGDEQDDFDDASSVASSSIAPSTMPDSNLTLDQLIARHSYKPDENFDIHVSQATGGRPLVGDALTGKFSNAKEGTGKLVPSKFVKGAMMREYDDIEAGYGSESSTEENTNTIGNVPIEWYDDLPHIGYDVSGRKIMRPAKGDELDKFLATVEDPDSWQVLSPTTAEDKLLQKQVQLSDKELDIIRRLQNAENPDADFDPYQETIEWFTGKGNEMTMPLSAAPEPKRRFVPSKWEHKKVMKIVKAIREGRIVPNRPAAEKPKVYGIWSNDDVENPPHAMYMPAPQIPPPRTVESYNPPEEYLFDEGEKREWEQQEKEDRKLDFMPQKHDALRHVPGYENFVQERFERCLDLYLAPRTRKVKLNIDPESLVPKLPSPKELRPFPTNCAVQYRHPANSRVRCVSVDARGEWVASGSEDGIVRVWDLGNGREVWRWNLKGGPVQAVEWSPNKEECILSAAVAGRIYLLAPLALISPHVAQTTLTHLNTAFSSSSASSTNNISGKPQVPDAKWVRPSEDERDRGMMVIVEVQGTPKQVTWHRKGDYFATVAVDAANKSVLIHQLSKHQTQSPFKRTKGSVQRVAFHPHKPHFFVATQRYVRIYDLVGQQLLKTLMTGLKWISSMDIHPLGDNLIVGSYDKKLCWFDLDLSTKPYKTLRYHTKALRSVAYHRAYPLFASASDDGSIHIFHGTVYTDLMQNPLIVPLKVLRGHQIKDGLGVLDLRWHPTKPWLISSGADGEVRLWSS